MATIKAYSILLSLSSIPKSNSIPCFSIPCNSNLLLPPILNSKTLSLSQIHRPKNSTLRCKVSASDTAAGAGAGGGRNLLLLEADPVDNSQIIDSAATDGGVSSIISVLLFVAFLGLSILTIGVIYIAVTDFLQKREREKFEKEEAAKKKSNKKGGKFRARTRAGPRGFGQKIEENDNNIDDDAAE